MTRGLASSRVNGIRHLPCTSHVMQLSLGDFYKTLRIPKATWDISYANNQARDEKESGVRIPVFTRPEHTVEAISWNQQLCNHRVTIWLIAYLDSMAVYIY
jgi:hypothetical protein